MAVLIADDQGKLHTPGTKLSNAEALEIGQPFGIELRTFWPGNNIKEWGKRAEILITAQIRTVPQPEAAQRRIVLLLKNYPFKRPFPIQDIGGDVFGDKMIFYSKSFEGHAFRMTLRGVEVDGMGDKFYEQARTAIGKIGQLAYFTSAAPYLAAAGVVTRLVNLFEKWFAKDDRLSTQRTDLDFDKAGNTKHLQSGRYLFWDSNWDGAPKPNQMRAKYRISGGADELPNLVVGNEDAIEYRGVPYFVVKVSSDTRSEYDNYVIGANSAQLLNDFGADPDDYNIINAIEDAAKAINDAHQMKDIIKTSRALGRADAAEKDALKKLLTAQVKNLTDQNAEFVRELLNNDG